MVNRDNGNKSCNDVVKATAQIIGIEQVEDVINKLPVDISKRILKQAVKASGKTLESRMASNLERVNKILGSSRVDIKDMIGVWTMKSSKTWRAGYFYGSDPLYKRNIEGQVYDKYKAIGGRSLGMWAIRGPLWMEYGTSGRARGKHVERYKRKSAWKYPGATATGAVRKIPPTGWFRRAIDTSIPTIERDFRGILHKKINGYLDRYIKKTGYRLAA